jgi:hypothetical protein
MSYDTWRVTTEVSSDICPFIFENNGEIFCDYLSYTHEHEEKLYIKCERKVCPCIKKVKK